MADYTLSAKVTGDASSYEKTMKRVQTITENFDSKVNKMAHGMVSVGGKLTLGLTTPLVVAAKQMVSSASDYQENLNKIDVAFGKSGKAVTKWAKNAKKQFGMSNNEALEATALFGDMAEAMGITQESALEMSMTLAGLAGDMASFKNADVKQVMTALKGVFTGETESIKEFGIILTQTNLEEFAAKIGKNYKEMSQAEKVQLRYNYVLSAGKNSMGDYARTADGTANTLRTFKKSVEDLLTVFGANLLPSVTKIVGKMTEMVDSLASASPETQKTVLAVGGLAAGLGPAIGAMGQMFLASQGLSSVFASMKGKIAQIPLGLQLMKTTAVGAGKDFKNLGGAIVESVANPQIKKNTAEIIKIGKDFKNLGGEMAKPFTDSKIGQSAKNMSVNIIKSLTDSKIGQSAKGMVGTFKDTGTLVGQYCGMLGKQIDGKLNGTFSKVGKGIGSFKGYMSSLGTAFAPITSKISNFSGAFKGSLSSIGSALQPIISKVGSFSTVFMKGFNIMGVIGLVTAGLGLLNNNFGTEIEKMISTVTEKGPAIIMNLTNGIVQNLPVLIESGRSLLMTIMNGIVLNLPNLIQSAFRIISALVSGISSQLPYLIPMALMMIMTLVQGVVDNIGMIIDAGLELLTGLTDGIVAAIPVLTQQLPTIIKTLVRVLISRLPQIIQTGIKILVTLATGIINAIPELVAMLPEIIDTIKESFAQQDWGQIGKDIIDGLINGLKSMLSSLWNTVKDVANSVGDTFKSILGIHSPSKLFMQFGIYTDKGYAIGIDKGKKQIYKELSNLQIPQTFESSKLPTTSTVSAANTAPMSQARADLSGFGDYVVSATTSQFSKLAEALEKGIGSMRMVADGRETARFVSSLGFQKAGAR